MAHKLSTDLNFFFFKLSLIVDFLSHYGDRLGFMQGFRCFLGSVSTFQPQTSVGHMACCAGSAAIQYSWASSLLKVTSVKR